MSEKIGNITLWLNVHRKNEKEPGFRGKLDVNGKSYEVSIWEDTLLRDIPIHLSGQITEKEDGS